MAEEATVENNEQDTPAVEKPKVDIEAARKQWEETTTDKARKQGWKPLEEYVEERGTAEGWRSPDAYLMFTDFRSTLKRKDEDFERQIAGVNTLMQASLKAQRDELESKRDLAIEAGDKNAVKAIDKQINKLETPVVQGVPQKDPLEAAWEAANPWINEAGPKRDAANLAYMVARNNGKSVTDALAEVDEYVKIKFPGSRQPPRQTTVPESERGRGPAGHGKKAPAATMETLTDDERKIWTHSGDMWKHDQKAFLESVNNIRKAQEKA